MLRRCVLLGHLPLPGSIRQGEAEQIRARAQESRCGLFQVAAALILSSFEYLRESYVYTTHVLGLRRISCGAQK
jgi:hypothetical protein